MKFSIEKDDEIKLEILNDTNFYRTIKNSKIENDRFNIKQFEKNKNRNDGYYCLTKNNQILAACQMQSNRLGLNDLYINEVQALQKGYGKQLLQKIFSEYKNVWLMAEPGNENLKNYYEMFNLSEIVLDKKYSCYDVDTYFFTNITDLERFNKAIIKNYHK